MAPTVPCRPLIAEPHHDLDDVAHRQAIDRGALLRGSAGPNGSRPSAAVRLQHGERHGHQGGARPQHPQGPPRAPRAPTWTPPPRQRTRSPRWPGAARPRCRASGAARCRGSWGRTRRARDRARHRRLPASSARSARPSPSTDTRSRVGGVEALDESDSIRANLAASGRGLQPDAPHRRERHVLVGQIIHHACACHSQSAPPARRPAGPHERMPPLELDGSRARGRQRPDQLGGRP